MQKRTLWKLISVLAMMAAACGGGDGGSEDPAPPTAAAPAFDPATAGNISGMVMIDGEMPAAEELTMNSDPVCAMSATNTMSNTFVGGDGHLGNVFIYVKEVVYF